MMRRIFPAFAIALLFSGAVLAARSSAVLPSGWRLTLPQGTMVTVGTMPQGMALSPDGTQLAVLESGVDPAALRILNVPSLTQRTVVALPGAFGKPLWSDASHLVVAGANADAVLSVDVSSGVVTRVLETGKGSWPAAVALDAGGHIASANDGNGSVTVSGTNIAVGAHPSDLVYARDGARLFVSLRARSEVAVIDTASKTIVTRIPVGLHPGALALSSSDNTLYVAESDDDSVGTIDTRSMKRTGAIAIGFDEGRLKGNGASPDALLVRGHDLFVALGSQNAIARVRDGHIVERIPAGWYPTAVEVGPDGTLYEANGFGERAPPNPRFDYLHSRSPYYAPANNLGSVRSVPLTHYEHEATESAFTLAASQPLWTAPPAARTVLRAHGPIAHVIYVIKENRTYDQVLGDMREGDGDPSLTNFGEKITPNQHALSRRFGLFDNAFTDAAVSPPGHNWTDAAFANEFVQRFWPPNYGGRQNSYEFQDGSEPDVPRNGYLWDAAKRAHVSYRDYGEDEAYPAHGPKIPINTFAGLAGHFDPAYAGWDLNTSDRARFEEWHHEFVRFVGARNLPQLEIVYLPNDHTAGTRSGSPTPQAYVAMNDWMVGKLVESVSRSPYWKSTAIFILEDDAQNGADHVSDQRSTFYIASPYARGGIRHQHYSTSSVVRSIELILGLKPLSIYDATARPLYDAFSTAASNLRAFSAVQPSVDMNAVNAKTAYGAQVSANLDFSRPDAADPKTMLDILMHAAPPGR
jgi:DNA-binding beta-propeller fold protein YncE